MTQLRIEPAEPLAESNVLQRIQERIKGQVMTNDQLEARIQLTETAVLRFADLTVRNLPSMQEEAQAWVDNWMRLRKELAQKAAAQPPSGT